MAMVVAVMRFGRPISWHSLSLNRFNIEILDASSKTYMKYLYTGEIHTFLPQIAAHDCDTAA